MKKLTRAQAKAIREEWQAGGVRQGELAIKYGVAQSNISHIVNNKTFRDPEPEPEIDDDLMMEPDAMRVVLP